MCHSKYYLYHASKARANGRRFSSSLERRALYRVCDTKFKSDDKISHSLFRDYIADRLFLSILIINTRIFLRNYNKIKKISIYSKTCR